MNPLDYVEVARTAHQLAADHGTNAHLCAARLSREVATTGKLDEAAF